MSWRRVAQTAFVYGATVALVAYVALTTDVERARQILGSTRLDLLALYTALSAAAVLLYGSFVVRFALARTGTKIGYGQLVRLEGLSYLPRFVNTGVGLAFIAWQIDKQKGQGFLRSLGTLVFLDVLNVFNLALLVTVASVLAAMGGQMTVDGWIFGVAVAVVVGVLLAPWYWRVESRIPLLRSLTGTSLFEALRAFRLRDYLTLSGLKLPLLLFEFWLDYLVARLFGLDIPFWAFASVYPIIVFAAALPVSVHGIGAIQVAARLMLIGFVAEGSAGADDWLASIDSFSTSILFMGIAWRVVTGLLLSLLGGGYLLRQRSGRASADEAGHQP
jgi:hypothetical protein